MANYAALVGSTSKYYLLPHNHVVIERSDGEIKVVSELIFDDLFTRIDYETAALKTDCIEYAIYHVDKPIEEYPEWLAEAVYRGYIYKQIFSGVHGKLTMDDEAAILRNPMGELMYMELDMFGQYYDY